MGGSSGFVSFLKKFGEDVLKGVGLVAGFAPVVISALPGSASTTVGVVVSDLTKIAGAVQTAEGMIGAISAPTAQAGPQKLAAATPFVSQIIQEWLASGQLGSNKIKDQTAFTAAVTGITSNFADLLNSIEA